jgi:hypothetical protein
LLPDVSKEGTAFVFRVMSQFTDSALKMKAVSSFETSGSNYPITWYSDPAELVPQYENRFATSNVFELFVVSTG